MLCKSIVTSNLFLMLIFAPLLVDAQQETADCKALKSELDSLILESKSCSTADDCTVENLRCPFNCAEALSKSAVQRVTNRILSFRSHGCKECMYRCAMTGYLLECSEGKCVTQWLAPSLDTSPSPTSPETQ